MGKTTSPPLRRISPARARLWSLISFCVKNSVFITFKFLGGVGGLILGASRPFAVEFSFFLAIPTMVAASGYSLLKHGAALSGGEWIAVAVGFVVSFFVSWGTVVLFMKYIRTKDFNPFGWYRIGLAIVLAVLLICGVLTN